MIARFRKLSRLFDALAFANVGNLGELGRELARTERVPAAEKASPRREMLAAKRRCVPYDPRFAGWMAKWAAMAATADRVEALEVENVDLRRRLDGAMRDRDDLIAALARRHRVPGIG